MGMTIPLHGPVRYAVVTAGVIVSGLVVLLALPLLTSPRGAAGPTVLQSVWPGLALPVTAVVVLVAAVLGGVIGRVTNAVVGVFVLGAGVGALAFATVGVRELAFGGYGSTVLVGVELLVLAVVALAAVLLVFRIAGPLEDIEPGPDGEQRGYWSAMSWKSAACGVVTLIGVWFVAQTPMRTQAIAAVVVGSMVAGLAGRLLFLGAQPVLLFVAPIVLGGVAWLIVPAMSDLPLDAALVADEMSPLLHVMPLDYMAGSLMGVSLGLGWARSFVHEEPG